LDNVLLKTGFPSPEMNFCN